MSTRWPPTVGIVGFDGGHKPAVSLAVRPIESKAEEEGTPSNQEIGACCYNDGTCDELTEFECRTSGGYFQGPGTTCDPNPCVGACCEPGCVEGETPDSCAGSGGTFQGFGTTCDPNPCPSNTGACCNLDTFECTDGVTHDDCVASGGIYLGDGSACSETTCECCPVFDHYTEIHFSGQVIGCSGGTINLPEKIWTRVASGAGCDVDTFQFATDVNCECSFKAQNCFPFTEVDYIEIDDTGSCDALYSGCVELAHILCDGTVNFEASTSAGTCCDVNSALNLVGPYDLTAGPIDLTFSADVGDPSIQFRFILSLA